MSHTRYALIQKAISEALNGNTTMLIFSLKNLCGWADKQELDVAQNTFTLNYNLEKHADEYAKSIEVPTSKGSIPDNTGHSE